MTVIATGKSEAEPGRTKPPEPETPGADIEVEQQGGVGGPDIRIDEDAGVGAPDIKPER